MMSFISLFDIIMFVTSFPATRMGGFCLYNVFYHPIGCKSSFYSQKIKNALTRVYFCEYNGIMLSLIGGYFFE